MNREDMIYVTAGADFSPPTCRLRHGVLRNITQQAVEVYSETGYGNGRATIRKPRS